MEADFLQERRAAHQLLDLLPVEKLNVVRNLLEALVEPLSQSLSAVQFETEDIAPDVAAKIDRARASLARGEGIPHEQILREFGLSE